MRRRGEAHCCKPSVTLWQGRTPDAPISPQAGATVLRKNSEGPGDTCVLRQATYLEALNPALQNLEGRQTR